MSDPRRSNILLAAQDNIHEEEDEDLPLTMIEDQEEAVVDYSTIPPSPYPQHDASSNPRFHNALNRVKSHPDKDAEAWEALLTEVQSCQTDLLGRVHQVNVATHQQVSWVEGVYQTVLHYFPYAVQQAVKLVELWLAICDGQQSQQQRTRRYEAKLDELFERLLGVKPSDSGDNSKEEKTTGNKNPCLALGSHSVELWKLYIRYTVRTAQRQALQLPPDDRAPHIRTATLRVYDQAVSHTHMSPTHHELWQDVLAVVRSWTTPGEIEPALQQKQMLTLRQLYQQLVVIPMTGLDILWQQYEAFEKAQNEALAAALIAEWSPKYQHARTVYLERQRVYQVPQLQLDRLAVLPVEKEVDSNDEYRRKLAEEHSCLTVWRTRISYERTNPERLSATDLTWRIRQLFHQLAASWTRHVEVWHMWSAWEDNGSSAVLALAQRMIPDSTLLALEAAALEERKHDPTSCLAVWEALLHRSPTTLGFVGYQRAVRRYQGQAAARAVFARARRELRDGEDKKEEDQDRLEEDIVKPEDDQDEAMEGSNTELNENHNGHKRGWVVTNRLDPAIDGRTRKKTRGSNSETSDKPSFPPGIITWHLYTAHAVIEHRLNRQPAVAARVFELGLRKHASFLTKPAYLHRYAQLLLELGDTINLRALLARAVAACTDLPVALAAVWKLNLQLEAVLTGTDPVGASVVSSLEAQRRQAVWGPDVEDVAAGGWVGAMGQETALIGAQKSSIAEQLLRTEGYDVSSKVANGLQRTVDLLGVMGMWGDDSTETHRHRRSPLQEDDLPGGKSDTTFQQRLNYMEKLVAGSSGDADNSSKALSARERLQQPMAGAGSAMMLAIQQSPEWLRALLLLLPASKLRLPIVGKPPPHLTEMALDLLKQNELPADRPSGVGGRLANDSDDENGGATVGYGSQFRARQKARQQVNGLPGLS